MGSNGTMRFTWTASTISSLLVARSSGSNGTIRFTWTASILVVQRYAKN